MVVGTVIDMEMTDELRVTVVAAGIGAERKPDISLVNSEGSRLTQPAKEYGNTQSSEPRSAVGGTEGQSGAEGRRQCTAENDLEYLDIPAFLRKQAD